MGAASEVIDRTMRAVWGTLPHGQLLTPEVWARRHRGIVRLLWAHVAGIVAFAMVRGFGVAHGLQESSLVALLALAATHPALARRARSAAAVLGLITASAVLVHLSGGVVEMHFHFFVMIGGHHPLPGLGSGWPRGTSARARPSCSGGPTGPCTRPRRPAATGWWRPDPGGRRERPPGAQKAPGKVTNSGGAMPRRSKGKSSVYSRSGPWIGGRGATALRAGPGGGGSSRTLVWTSPVLRSAT
jgi:hypothetical protein